MTVLVTAPYNKPGRDELEEMFRKVVYRSWKDHGQAFREDELIALLNETGASGLIAELDQVTENVISEAPSLQFVGVCRGMPSNVNIEAATKRGIPVFYTPARNAQAVAEMVVGSLITFYRHIIEASKWLREKNWKDDYLQAYLKFKGHEITGKTVGLVGFGAVGRRIATLLSVFECRILYYDPYVDEQDFPQYQQKTLKEVFAESDVISVHLPRTEETIDLISEEYFSLMKKEAIFVNTSRAVVVNREDLISALKEEKIGGAILDVFYHEPPEEPDYEIINLSNVLPVPHLAGATYEVEDHHVKIMNSALRRWLEEKTLDIPVLFNRNQLQKEKKGAVSHER
ncbi:2-hydroxyacid dehydrogenase [Fictibacillus enclensis]|uniref:2-hydroxyacid dehydrogenase n=1 Tax=Fictibacillus enclensis TaxID=1017270 RepID=UPI00259FF873|nr:2-hydroxyacid dehydrogenase [Fictibacillus enclensis]MDM5338411.1 2-hydroxyacid dehydrogenase [Fictibacillus enclensis]